MKNLNEKEMKSVNGGKWQCNVCKKKFGSYTSACLHLICTGHATSPNLNECFKWVWR